jgi:ribonuclease HIII
LIPLPKDLATFLRNSNVEIVRRKEIAHATQYFLSRGPDSANLTVYNTGKVVPGGKYSELRRMVEERLPKKSPSTQHKDSGTRPKLNATPRLGIDEAGKGDYFGPLVVVGVRVLDGESASRLQEIGVRDSKSLSVSQAYSFSERILDAIGTENACVVSLLPREFEQRRSDCDNNVNRLLEEVDAEIIGELKDEVECIVVDQFAASAQAFLEQFVPKGVRLEVRTRADSDDAAVAAASILARARYLEDLDRLSEDVGFELPRGATHVIESGRRVVRENDYEKLKDIAKVSFSTTSKVLSGLSEKR